MVTPTNRPFARSGHVVQNHTCWWASSAVGLPKQRQVQVDWFEWHCFGSPSVQLAHQHVWFCTLWPDRAKGLFIRSCQSTIVSANHSQTNRGFVTLPYMHSRNFRENRKNFKSVQYQCCPQTRNDRWLHLKKNLKTNLVMTYQQEWSTESIVKTVTKSISVKHQEP